MIYHGFFVKITEKKNLKREAENGITAYCDGFEINIYWDDKMEFLIDSFTAAVGHEIINNEISDAEQFAEDVIENEEKEYLRMIKEFENTEIT